MSKRESRCPLCGGTLSAVDLLDASSEVVDFDLGVIATRCPHCQGYLEVMPTPGQLDVGYSSGTGKIHFEAVMSLLCASLERVCVDDPPCMIVSAPGRSWRFEA